MASSLLAAGPFGLEISRQQVLGLGLVLAGVVAGFFLLLWIARRFRKRGIQGGGLLLFAALVYLPLLGAYGALAVLDFNRQVVNAGKVAAGEPAIYEDYPHANALQFVLVVLGVYLAFTLTEAVLFTKEREARYGWKVPGILREILRWMAVTAGAVIAAMVIWHEDFRNVAIFTSALGIAATFAIGPTLGSLISGLTLMAERPFEIGDWIEVEGRQGRVDQVTWRSTRIITRENESVIFPNAKLAEWKIVNLSRPDGRLRIRLGVGVHYRTPPAEAREAIRRAILGTPGVLDDPPPVIRIADYGESAVHWDVRVWVADPGPLEDIRAEILQRIWYSFDRSGIEIPFPIRNLVMRDRGWEGRPPPGEAAEAERRKRNEDLLRKVPILGMLPAADFGYLASRAREESYLEGERVTRQGEPGDRMFVVLEGRVRVAVDVRGPREIAVLGPGEVFGEMSLLTGAPRTATVVALGPVRVLSVRSTDMKPVLEKHPEFARDMASFAAARMIGLEEQTAAAEARGPTADLQTTSTDLLKEIMRFFRLPGYPGRPGKP